MEAIKKEQYTKGRFMEMYRNHLRVQAKNKIARGERELELAEKGTDSEILDDLIIESGKKFVELAAGAIITRVVRVKIIRK